MISSQLIFVATIVHLFIEQGTAVSKKIKEVIYVRNLISGTNTEGSALQIYVKCKEIFQEMSLNLTE